MLSDKVVSAREPWTANFGGGSKVVSSRCEWEWSVIVARYLEGPQEDKARSDERVSTCRTARSNLALRALKRMLVNFRLPHRSVVHGSHISPSGRKRENGMPLVAAIGMGLGGGWYT